MPKDTFYNLNEEKKKKIFDAAILEFSSRRFSEASINQIIKTAGIPRGSFYQYFYNKEDLYLYVLTEIGKEKLEVAHYSKKLKPEADFFETYLHMLQSIMEWARANPLYYQIGMLMDLDDSEFINNLKAKFQNGSDELKDQIEIDKQRGLIKQDIDSELVVEMIYTINLGFAKEYYKTGLDEEFIKKVTKMIDIIKGGIQIV